MKLPITSNTTGNNHRACAMFGGAGGPEPADPWPAAARVGGFSTGLGTDGPLTARDQ
ncbi:MAG TPA: hypothetical protein VGH89_22980 [Pseudonocardia sp.]